jgi:branched-chain amino acid transport system substrate-binding protein
MPIRPSHPGRRDSSRRRLPYLALALGVAALLGLTACSSSKSGAGTSGGSSSPAATSTSSGTAAPSGGSSGTAASGSVVKIGFANMTTGTTSFPAILANAQAAVKYVNAKLGGLGGHPIQLVPCDVKNDAQSAQECGQQFANDSSIPFAILGQSLAGTPYYAAMAAANKPTLGIEGITPADNAPAGTYFYYPGSNYYPLLVNYLNNSGIKSLSYIYEGEASSEAGEKYVTSNLKSSIKVTATQVPANAADVSSQVAASGAGSSDMTMAFTVDCSRVATAFKSLSITPKKVIGDPGCLDLSTIDKDPSLYENWYFVENYKVSSVSGNTDPDVALFNAQRANYGAGGPVGAFGELGWGIILTAADMFKSSTGDITSASAAAVIKGFKGPVTMGSSSISCPGPAPYTATCTSGLYLYQVRAGKLYEVQPIQ